MIIFKDEIVKQQNYNIRKFIALSLQGYAQSHVHISLLDVEVKFDMATHERKTKWYFVLKMVIIYC